MDISLANSLYILLLPEVQCWELYGIPIQSKDPTEKEWWDQSSHQSESNSSLLLFVWLYKTHPQKMLLQVSETYSCTYFLLCPVNIVSLRAP